MKNQKPFYPYLKVAKKKKVKISKERPHKYSIPKNSQQSGLVFILAVTCLRKSQIAHLKTQGLK